MSNPPAPMLTFVDSNIWLYAFHESQDRQKTQQAKRFIRRTQGITVSTQVINEVCFTMLRKFGAAEPAIQKLIGSFYQKYVVIEVHQAIIMEASTLRTQYHLSYWDGLIYSMSSRAGR